MKALLPIALVVLAALPQVPQAPTTPPMKMGLWETAGTLTPAGPNEKPFGHVTRSCLTADNWLTMMGPNGAGTCPKVNEVWTSHTYSFSVQCAGKPKIGSVLVAFDNAETHHITIDFFGATGAPTMHGAAVATWKGTDCGDVSPNMPIIVAKPGATRSR